MGTFSFQLLAHGYRSCLSLQTDLPLMPLVPACCQTSLPSLTSYHRRLTLVLIHIRAPSEVALEPAAKAVVLPIEAFAPPSQVIIDVIAIGLFIHLGGALCKK